MAGQHVIRVGVGVADELFGPYRVESLVGRGGMGEVYRAFDTVKGRTVALKRLPPHLAADAQFQARFRRESEVAARLREAHVIPIHDFGEIDGRLFIDMRLVDGVDLGALLERDGALAAERAVRIVEQIAGALDAAHADGLLHRDVKPSNVLVTGAVREDFAYLVDFGIAVPMGGSRLTATGSAIGTMAYMAPEVFDGRRGDHRIDVYSLACLLYELLTGRKPFDGNGIATMMYAHLNLAPPRPSHQRPDLPPGFDQVITRGMAKDPEHRYQSAGDLARDAHRALTPRLSPTPAVPAGAPTVIRRTTPRLPPRQPNAPSRPHPAQGPPDLPPHARPNPPPAWPPPARDLPPVRFTEPPRGGNTPRPEGTPARIPAGRVAYRITLWWITFILSFLFASLTLTGLASGFAAGLVAGITVSVVTMLLLASPLGGTILLLRLEIRKQRLMLGITEPKEASLLTRNALSTRHVRVVAAICAGVAIALGLAIAIPVGLATALDPLPPDTSSGLPSTMSTPASTVPGPSAPPVLIRLLT